jgi:GT2 family glycosyltransferase
VIPLFHIIIVVYNNGPEVQDTLDALAIQKESRFSVTILDNYCPIKSTEYLKIPDTRFKIITSSENLGFAGGCNLAAKNTEAPWLIMLNPDAHPQIDWLSEIKIGIETYDVGMFGSTQIMGQTPNFSDGFGDVWSIFGYCWRGGYGHKMETLPTTDRRVLSPCAAASIYRRDLFERLNGFDEVYFCYLEDVDLGLRMQAIGSGCIQLRKAMVMHIGGSSQKKGSLYSLKQSAKNSPRLILKNAPACLLPIMLSLYIFSQVWFYFRSHNDNQKRERWTSLKLGLKFWRFHLRSRRKTKRISHRQLFEFLDWRINSLRSLPIKSKPAKPKS